MNVLYIGGFNLPNKNAAAQRVISNAKLLRDLGYDVLLVGLSTDASNTEFEFEGLRCKNLEYPKNILQWIQYLASIKQYEEFLFKRPQIVIAYNHPAIALKKLADYCKRNNIKLIADCTEWYEPHGGWLFRQIKGWDIKKRMFDVHCQMDGVIAISKYLYDFYSAHGVHTLQLPPLVDKLEDKWQQEVESDSDTIRLVFAGSVGGGYKDRLDLIIEALGEVVRKIKNTIVLDVIGINEKQYKEIFSQNNDLFIPDFVKFHGRVEHLKAISLLKSADFQIFIRDNSLANTAGFPTKFAETISAGAMVLTNASSNITDYLQEGRNGYLLDVTNVQKTAESLTAPLSLDKKTILEKRKQIDANVFDYHNYKEVMKDFIEKL